MREVTSELLVKDDRQIVALGTAEEALKEFSEQAFDVVITDVSLPAMSGLDLARNILILKPRTSIIVASGYFLDLSLQKWGPNVRAIIKPFEAPEIDPGHGKRRDGWHQRPGDDVVVGQIVLAGRVGSIHAEMITNRASYLQWAACEFVCPAMPAQAREHSGVV